MTSQRPMIKQIIKFNPVINCLNVTLHMFISLLLNSLTNTATSLNFRIAINIHPDSMNSLLWPNFLELQLQEHTPACLPTCRTIGLPGCLCPCLPAYLSIYLSVRLLSFCWYVCLSVHLSTYLSIYLSG